MKKIAPVVGLNLLILLCYTAIFSPSLISDMVGALVLHEATCLGIGIYYSATGNRKASLAWILAMLVVALAGFSACLGLFRLNL